MQAGWFPTRGSRAQAPGSPAGSGPAAAGKGSSARAAARVGQLQPLRIHDCNAVHHCEAVGADHIACTLDQRVWSTSTFEWAHAAVAAAGGSGGMICPGARAPSPQDALPTIHLDTCGLAVEREEVRRHRRMRAGTRGGKGKRA